MRLLGWSSVFCFVLPVMSILSACGGTSSDVPVSQEPPVYMDYWSISTGGELSVRIFALDPTTGQVTELNGTFYPGTNRMELGSLSGTVSGDRKSIQLDSGGIMDLAQGSSEFLSSFVAQPVSGNPSFGSMGVPTYKSDMPQSGSATYAGQAQIVATDGPNVYDLTGSVGVDANFQAGNLSVNIDNITGTVTDGLSAPVSVSDPFEMVVQNGTIDRNRFFGGTILLMDSDLSRDLSGHQVQQFEGGFFGPGAGSVGGAFSIIDDMPGSHDDLTIMGTMFGH